VPDPLRSLFADPRPLALLLLAGLALLGGTIARRWLQRLRIPQGAAYILIGIFLGQSGLGWISHDLTQRFAAFNLYALGIIGFIIGGGVQREFLRKYGRQLLVIVLSEGLGAFILVAGAAGLLAYHFTQDWANALGVGLVLGAIAAATAPALTLDVLWEQKTRGILTTTLVALVAFDDGLALLLYGMAASVAAHLTRMHAETALWGALARAVMELAGGVVLGATAGWLLSLTVERSRDTQRATTFAIGAVALAVGLTLLLGLDLILGAMTLGLTLVNLAPRRSRPTFVAFEQAAQPIFVLFFLLVGAELNLARVPSWLWAVAIAYLLGRSAGKLLGANLGARWAGAAPPVRRYLGLCLFGQAGVAIGLSILAGARFSEGFGNWVVLVITATTLVAQVVAPAAIRLGVKRAGEVGRNITREDLVTSLRVRDVMDAAPPTLSPSTPLEEVLRTFARHEYVSFPVVDARGELLGMVSFEEVRATLAGGDYGRLLVAHDLLTPAPIVLEPEMPLAEAIAHMREGYLECLPVVDPEEGKVVGLLHAHALNRALEAEVLRRQQYGEGNR